MTETNYERMELVVVVPDMKDIIDGDPRRFYYKIGVFQRGDPNVVCFLWDAQSTRTADPVKDFENTKKLQSKQWYFISVSMRRIYQSKVTMIEIAVISPSNPDRTFLLWNNFIASKSKCPKVGWFN